jgi:hypothetical protein
LAFFGLRLSDDLAARFDAATADVGGRSAALRALIERESAGIVSYAGALRKRPPSGRHRVEVRLNAADMAALDAAARDRGMTRADWIATIVRHRLNRGGPPPIDVRQALVDAWRQIKRVGINLNQAVHALHSARMEGSRLDVAREAERVAGFRDEVLGHVAEVRAALAGEGAYWATTDDR